jgi:hypothetical protein
MENLRGKVVLVYFYTGASSGYPRERARLEPHLACLKGRPVALVMVAATSPTLLAKKVQADPAPPAAVLSAGTAKESGFTRPPFAEWGVFTSPTAVLVDAQGVIRYRFTAPDTGTIQEPAFSQRLDAALDRLVGEAVQR